MRRLLLILMLCVYAAGAKGQAESDEDILTARVLALDTSVAIAKRFSEAVGSMANGYSLAFIDKESKNYVRYVFKNTKEETLRIDYGFSMRSTDEEGNAPRQAVVNLQRISGELGVITTIYNFLFGASLTPERVMSSMTRGSRIKYRDKTGDFSFLPDDYEPGYWVMTFIK